MHERYLADDEVGQKASKMVFVPTEPLEKQIKKFEVRLVFYLRTEKSDERPLVRKNRVPGIPRGIQVGVLVHGGGGVPLAVAEDPVDYFSRHKTGVPTPSSTSGLDPMARPERHIDQAQAQRARR